jgi:hypothetical protein
MINNIIIKRKKIKREDKSKKGEKEKYNNIIYVSCKLYYSSYNYYRIRNTLPKVS